MSKFKVGDRVQYKQWDDGVLDIDLHATVLEVDTSHEMVRYEILHDDGIQNKCVSCGNVGDYYWELTEASLNIKKSLMKHYL